MIPYREQKIEQAICKMAQRHREKSSRPLYSTFLYKYLAFMDFRSLEDTGIPAFHFEYRAMPYGPVPLEIYEKRGQNHSEYYRWNDLGENRYTIEVIRSPELKYFSRYELDLLDRMIADYAEKFSSTIEISEESHNKIRAWKIAHDRKPNSIIDFADTFATQEDKNYHNWLLYRALSDDSRFLL